MQKHASLTDMSGLIDGWCKKIMIQTCQTIFVRERKVVRVKLHCIMDWKQGKTRSFSDGWRKRCISTFYHIHIYTYKYRGYIVDVYISYFILLKHVYYPIFASPRVMGRNNNLPNVMDFFFFFPVVTHCEATDCIIILSDGLLIWFLTDIPYLSYVTSWWVIHCECAPIFHFFFIHYYHFYFSEKKENCRRIVCRKYREYL